MPRIEGAIAQLRHVLGRARSRRYLGQPRRGATRRGARRAAASEVADDRRADPAPRRLRRPIDVTSANCAAARFTARADRTPHRKARWSDESRTETPHRAAGPRTQAITPIDRRSPRQMMRERAAMALGVDQQAIHSAPWTRAVLDRLAGVFCSLISCRSPAARRKARGSRHSAATGEVGRRERLNDLTARLVTPTLGSWTSSITTAASDRGAGRAPHRALARQLGDDPRDRCADSRQLLEPGLSISRCRPLAARPPWPPRVGQANARWRSPSSS